MQTMLVQSSPSRPHFPIQARPLPALHSNVLAASESSSQLSLYFPDSPSSTSTHTTTSSSSPLQNRFRNALIQGLHSDANMFSTCSNANRGTRSSFRPARAAKGTNSWQLKQFAEATLGSGSLRKVVRLPEGEDKDEWLAVNVVDFYNQINLLYGAITEFCSPHSCPEMKATDEYDKSSASLPFCSNANMLFSPGSSTCGTTLQSSLVPSVFPLPATSPTSSPGLRIFSQTQTSSPPTRECLSRLPSNLPSNKSSSVSIAFTPTSTAITTASSEVLVSKPISTPASSITSCLWKSLVSPMRVVEGMPKPSGTAHWASWSRACCAATSFARYIYLVPSSLYLSLVGSGTIGVAYTEDGHGFTRYALFLLSSLLLHEFHITTWMSLNERPRFVNSYFNFAFFVIAVAQVVTNLNMKLHSSTQKLV
jgi:hypothetical protein